MSMNIRCRSDSIKHSPDDDYTTTIIERRFRKHQSFDNENDSVKKFDGLRVDVDESKTDDFKAGIISKCSSKYSIGSNSVDSQDKVEATTNK